MRMVRDAVVRHSMVGTSVTLALTVGHRTFSKKLKVDADLGDTKEQIKKSKEYSELLSTKKSVASILNFMDVNDFESVEGFVREAIDGGRVEISFIMKKKK